jgi:hypothetical protein
MPVTNALRLVITMLRISFSVYRICFGVFWACQGPFGYGPASDDLSNKRECQIPAQLPHSAAMQIYTFAGDRVTGNFKEKKGTQANIASTLSTMASTTVSWSRPRASSSFCPIAS